MKNRIKEVARFVILASFIVGCSVDMVEADNASGHVHAENAVGSSSGGNGLLEEIPPEPVVLPSPSSSPEGSPVVSPSPSPGTGSGPKTVTFRIAKGTGSASWNTVGAAIQLNVGDTLIIQNDDTVSHQLHTNGVPCGHASLPTRPGKSHTCKIQTAFDGTGFGALHDHLYGNGAKFYLKAVK